MVDSTSGTILLTDEFGDPVNRPLMYFERAQEELARIKNFGSAAGLEERGVKLSATSPLPKILKNKEALDRSTWVLSPTTWLLYKPRYGKREMGMP